MKVVVDAAAIGDLESIRTWIEHDSPRASKKVIERLFETFGLLSTFPEIGRPGRDAGTREWPVPRLPYVVVYEPDYDRDELIITAVFHGAQDR